MVTWHIAGSIVLQFGHVFLVRSRTVSLWFRRGDHLCVCVCVHKNTETSKRITVHSPLGMGKQCLALSKGKSKVLTYGVGSYLDYSSGADRRVREAVCQRSVQESTDPVRCPNILDPWGGGGGL